MTASDALPGLLARIHLERLRANIDLVRGRVPDGIQILGVVKCDGYGHGAVAVAREMIARGINRLVVASISEGIILRRAGITCPVLVLSDPLHPRLQDAVEYGLTITVGDAEFARKLLDLAAHLQQRFPVQVKIDVGLCRFGLYPEQAPQVMAALMHSPFIEVQGIYGHLSCTFDHDPASNAETRRQVARFHILLDELESLGMLPPMVHLGSSTGFLGFPDELCSGRMNALRIGTLFYGFMERCNDWDRQPEPVAELSAPILQVRNVPAHNCIGYHCAHQLSANGHIAVVHVGFEHGLHGDLSGVLRARVHGRPALLVGKPALIQSQFDVSAIQDVKPGDELLLAGQEVNMQRIAQSIGHGTWELLIPLLKNARRVYCNASPSPANHSMGGDHA